ncbi:DMT family transporter [Faecalispora jeddahensis]|jgi:transporter family-2 protein|uniref:DMT family transporter n=1 Tax=Faecalispora jeddahensis TaxID=1414721 RepID=UPI0018985515|nr:DMT family transporter [Faecalispora jeddahensis]
MNFFLLLVSGICLGLMVSLNGRLAVDFNLFEVSFLVHLIGAVMLLAAAKLIQKEKIQLLGAPRYVYFVGFMGVAIIVMTSLSTTYIGAALTMVLSITAQLVGSAIVDHFGWFRVPVNKFSWRRVPAFAVILTGLLLMIFS